VQMGFGHQLLLFATCHIAYFAKLIFCFK